MIRSEGVNKLECLRKIVSNLAISDPVTSPQGPEWLRSLGFFVSWLKVETQQAYGIKLGGAQPFSELVDQMQTESRQYERGATFRTFSDAVAKAIASEFLGRQPDTITDADVSLVEGKVAAWFQSTALPRRQYVACTIIPDQCKPFEVGPVSFLAWDDFVQRERPVVGQIFDHAFEYVHRSMLNENAGWMAVLDVDGCKKERSSEIADLTVDVALVGLQLVIPHHYSERMARLAARSLPRNRETVSLVGGAVSTSGSNQQPGLGMSGRAFVGLLVGSAKVLESVGRRVAAYLRDSSGLPNLQQAWCDAAYWYHEGLAEPLDTIAVPKLETAIEVLMRAENTRGSERRLRQAMKAFFGLEADQTINPESATTVREFVKGFVTDRSRILHGTWSTLRTNLRTSRASLTAVVRQLLLDYTLALDGFSSDPAALDRIDAFLAWVEAQRAARATATNEGAP